MNKKNKKRRIIEYQYLLIFICLFGLAGNSQAAPSVSGVSGNIEDGQSITISGSGFGASGPSVVLFDDFSGATNGSQIPINAVIGTWSTHNTKGYSDSLLSNNMGARCAGSDGWYQNMALLGGEYTQVFISSRLYIPSGYKFPYSAGAETMPVVSSLKHHWVYYSSNGYTSNKEPDHFMINWTGDAYMNVCTNEGGTTSTGDPENPYDGGTYGTYWTWNSPMRGSLWIKSNGSSASGSDGTFQFISSAGQYNRRYDSNIIDGANTRIYPKEWMLSDFTAFTYDRTSVPGYLRSYMTWQESHAWYLGARLRTSPFNNFEYVITTDGTSGVSEPSWPTTDGAIVNDGTIVWTAYDTRIHPSDNYVIDDVYVAVGDNAAARVEIGNNQTYANCTKLAIATPTSWADGSITATVREGTFDAGETGYVFVVDKDNNVSPTGFEVTFGGDSGDTTAPNAPSGLSVS